MDCRVRYGLHLVEAIPRPGHKLSQTYIAAFRFREANSPGFVVQTWQKEGGLWRLVSFGIKTDGEAPPTDLVSATSKPPSVPSADAALALAADTLLTKWLIDRNYADAAKLFLPSAAICAGYAASGGQRNPSGSTSIRGFLEETAALAAKEKDLASLLSAAQLAHPELKLLDHPRTETYLLAEVPPEVVSVHSCAKSRAAAAGNAKPEGGFLMAFHFRHGAEDESGGVVSLFWRRTAGEWRIAWYGVSSD
jgi:hypothetical protein